MGWLHFRICFHNGVFCFVTPRFSLLCGSALQIISKDNGTSNMNLWRTLNSFQRYARTEMKLQRDGSKSTKRPWPGPRDSDEDFLRRPTFVPTFTPSASENFTLYEPKTSDPREQEPEVPACVDVRGVDWNQGTTLFGQDTVSPSNTTESAYLDNHNGQTATSISCLAYQNDYYMNSHQDSCHSQLLRMKEPGMSTF